MASAENSFAHESGQEFTVWWQLCEDAARRHLSRQQILVSGDLMGTQPLSEPRASRRSKPFLFRFIAIGVLMRVSAAYDQLSIICDHEIIINECVDAVKKPIVQTSNETSRRELVKDRRYLQTIPA